MQSQAIEFDGGRISAGNHALLYDLIIPKPRAAIVAAALDALKMIVAGRQTSGVRNFYCPVAVIGAGVLPVPHSVGHGTRAIDGGRRTGEVGAAEIQPLLLGR